MHFFDLVAYADNPSWSKCYCMERLVRDYELRTKDENRATRSELIRTGRARGLVAYRLHRVVGWCHAAPRGELVTAAEPASADRGAIVCFVTAPDQRRQGVASALLAAALPYLRDQGCRDVEAYPLGAEAEAARWVFANYVGPLTMYERAGFRIEGRYGDQLVVTRSLLDI